jgi:hypothetical protein
MSTLEKTINLLSDLPEKQIEIIYSYVQFVSSQQQNAVSSNEESLDTIFDNIVGVLPDNANINMYITEKEEDIENENYEKVCSNGSFGTEFGDTFYRNTASFTGKGNEGVCRCIR